MTLIFCSCQLRRPKSEFTRKVASVDLTMLTKEEEAAAAEDEEMRRKRAEFNAEQNRLHIKALKSWEGDAWRE